MKYTTLKFCEINTGQVFWSTGDDVGDPELAKVKIGPGRAEWKDTGRPLKAFYPSDFEVYIQAQSGWPCYLMWICVTILFLLAAAFGLWIVDLFRSI
jgi:hypothetical protein